MKIKIFRSDNMESLESAVNSFCESKRRVHDATHFVTPIASTYENGVPTKVIIYDSVMVKYDD